MRVTSNTFVNTLANQLNVLTQRQNRLQNQAATGQRIETPDDDPVAMQRVLNFQAESGRVANCKTISVINRISRLRVIPAFSRSRNFRIAPARSPLQPTVLKRRKDLAIYATEIDQILQQAVQTANTKIKATIFSRAPRAPPRRLLRPPAPMAKSHPFPTFGNQDLAAAEVSEGVTISSQVPGADSSGTGPHGLISDSRTGADFFAHLISLRESFAGCGRGRGCRDGPSRTRKRRGQYHFSSRSKRRCPITPRGRRGQCEGSQEHAHGSDLQRDRR